MQIAELQFNWLAERPLVSGYGQTFSEAAELIKDGEKRIIQYQSRNQEQALTPSLLATSVKGVLRSAAAWWVEHEGQIQQEKVAKGKNIKRRYITTDYANARPTEHGWRNVVGAIDRIDRLCPISRVFGGSPDDESRNSLRQQGLLRLSFLQPDLQTENHSDALFGTTQDAGRQVFAWEVASKAITGRSEKPLEAQQLRVDPSAKLLVQVQQPAHIHGKEDFQFAVALISLSADLISSGFFRFGRFTSRGYGWVRLVEPQGRAMQLADLIDGKAVDWQGAKDAAALAKLLLNEQEPSAIVRQAVKEWMR